MSEFKGTPGKWNVEFKSEVISIYTGDTAEDVYRGNGVWHDPNICGIWSHVDDERRKESEANANLIAAAPDLLEALQECIRIINWNDISCGERYNKAKTAIDKALAYEEV